ncbi:MAG: hypothetical protein WBP41_00040 [Saprospiraceae bacterium]
MIYDLRVTIYDSFLWMPDKRMPDAGRKTNSFDTNNVNKPQASRLTAHEFRMSDAKLTTDY